MKRNNWIFTNYIRHTESHYHTNSCCAELECVVTVKGFVTVNLSSLVLPPTVKSVSEKCRLQTYSRDSVLACSASQNMPSLSVHS